MNLLQIATGITKCDDYYKLRQYSCITSNPSCFLPKELQVTRSQFIVEWRSPPKIVTTTLVPAAVPYSARELGGIDPVLIQI